MYSFASDIICGDKSNARRTIEGPIPTTIDATANPPNIAMTEPA